MGSQVHEPRYEGFADAVRASFAQQRMMESLGAALVGVKPGRVEIELPFGAHIAQQHGTVHAGALASVMDSACGYAALTLMDEGSGVVSVEFKVNLLRPAMGNVIRAVGEVVKRGRTITVCEARAVEDEGDRLVGTMTGTMMCVRDREGVRG